MDSAGYLWKCNHFLYQVNLLFHFSSVKQAYLLKGRIMKKFLFSYLTSVSFFVGDLLGEGLAFLSTVSQDIEYHHSF